MHPVLLALAAAWLFAFGQHFARIALRYTDAPDRGALPHRHELAALPGCCPPSTSRVITGALRRCCSSRRSDSSAPSSPANLGMLGIRHLGPTISSTLAATSPLFGLALGFLVLAEALTVEVAVGALGVSVGDSGALLARRNAPEVAPLRPALSHRGGLSPRPRPRHRQDRLRGCCPTPSSRRWSRTTCPWCWRCSPTGGCGGGGPVPRAALPWLFLTGLVLGTAVLVLNHALLTGRLVVVAPILACAPLFTLLLGEGALSRGDSRSAGGDRGADRGAERGPHLGPGRLSPGPRSGGRNQRRFSLRPQIAPSGA